MSANVQKSIDFLPCLSPKWPKSQLPNGLVKKTMPYVAIERAIAVVSENLEKNTNGHTCAAAVVARKKSYHSMNVPTEAAVVTFASVARLIACCK
jgi:hypothetical protein